MAISAIEDTFREVTAKCLLSTHGHYKQGESIVSKFTLE